MCDGMTEHWQKLEGTHRAEDQTLLKKKGRKKERERERGCNGVSCNELQCYYIQTK